MKDVVIIMDNNDENLVEELYNLLAELLNRKMNRTVLDSIRGEYGVLRYLMYVQDKTSAGILTEQLHVVPGRMTDILNSLETKGFIKRQKSDEDRRRVVVCITESGREEACQKMGYIRNEDQGLFKILGRKDTEELIRLLGIVLSYHDDGIKE